MRHFFAFFCAIAVLLSSCEASLKENEYRVNVTGKNLEDGTQILLKRLETNKLVTEDTLTVNNERVTFKRETAGLDVLYLAVEGITGNVAFVSEPGEIEIMIHKDSINTSVLSGTISNDGFDTYLKGSKTFAERLGSMQTDLANAQRSGDLNSITALQEEYNELVKQAKGFEAEYVKNHPDVYISAVLVERLLLDKSKSLSEIKTAYTGLSDRVKDSKVGRNIAKAIANSENIEMGAVAPDFSGPNPEGKNLTMSELKGKLTLIDFWAAWCKPCRIENPNLVKVYAEYHDKGLNILGVSLDRSAAAWNKAIEDDALVWDQISNLQFWQDPIARLYQVRQIPANFLLDADGKIIAKDLRGPALETKISELLN